MGRETLSYIHIWCFMIQLLTIVIRTTAEQLPKHISDGQSLVVVWLRDGISVEPPSFADDIIFNIHQHTLSNSQLPRINAFLKGAALGQQL